MNPTMLAALYRLAPLLERFGARAGTLVGGLGSRAGMIQAPDVTVSPVPPQVQGGVAPPISTDNYSPTMTPNARVSDAFGAIGSPWHPAGVPLPQARPQEADQSAPGIPMPQPRPADAPQSMNFFQRNAAMMQDPSTGAFLDPQAATMAQNSFDNGSGLIDKFMKYFHNKGVA